MVKINQTDNLSVRTKKMYDKHRSFSGVEFKKTAKARRKSLAIALPTRLIQKKRKKEKSFIEWTVTEEKLVNNLSEKKKNSKLTNLSHIEEHIPFSSTQEIVKKKTKSISAKHVSNNKDNIVIPPISKNEQKRKKVSVEGASSQIRDLKLNSTNKVLEEEHVESKSNIVHLEKRFKIKAKDVEGAVKGVIKFRAENPKLQKQLFKDATPLFLQVSCIKIPSGHPKILRIPLPNLILTPEDEVCLIVPEVKGIKNIEHEKHIEHYEDLLRRKGVSNIKKIMTCHELRTEYETFEQKAQLVDLFHSFLVDGRVCGKVVQKCGKIFYKKRKVPTPVKLHVTKLKEHIDKALSKAFFFLHLKGDSYTVQFGTDRMHVEELVENIYSIIEFLSMQFPGGFKNIKGIQVFAERTPCIPVYLSFKNPNEVKTPKAKSKKPRSYKSYKGELTTSLNAEVTVRPTGIVLVNKLQHSKNKKPRVTTEKNVIETNKNEINKGNRKRKQNEQTSAVEVVKKKKVEVEDCEKNGQENKSTVNKGKNRKNYVVNMDIKELNNNKNKDKHSQNKVHTDKVKKKKSRNVDRNLVAKTNAVNMQTASKESSVSDLKNEKVLNEERKKNKQKIKKLHKQT